MWDVASGTLLAALPTDRHAPSRLVFCRNGIIASVGGILTPTDREGWFVALRSDTGEVLSTFEGGPDMLASPNGETLATVTWSEEGKPTIHIYEIPSGRELANFTFRLAMSKHAPRSQAWASAR
jgi:hypothetical protein